MGLRAKTTTKVIDKGYKKALQQIGVAKGQPQVAIGIQADAGNHPDGPSLALIAAANEFGTSRIPERSFIRSNMTENFQKYKTLTNKMIERIIAGKLTTVRALDLLGLKIGSDIQRKITMLKEPPNAPSTIRRKKSSNPLIDTGTLRRAIRHEVENVRKVEVISLRNLDKSRIKPARKISRPKPVTAGQALRSFGKSAKSANKSLRRSAKITKRVSKKASKAARRSSKKAVKGLRKTQKRAGKSIKRTTKKISRAGKRSLKRTTKATTRSLKKASRSSKRLTKKTVKSIKRQTKAVKKSTKKTVRSVKKRVKKTTKSIKKSLTRKRKRGGRRR